MILQCNHVIFCDICYVKYGNKIKVCPIYKIDIKNIQKSSQS